MSLYPELAVTADELLAEFGQAVTIRHTESVYNPGTGSSTQVVTDSVTVGAMFPYGDRSIDGTMILGEDQQVFVSPVGITRITPTERLIIGGENYSIVRVKTYAPAGVAVLHEVQVRK